MVLLLESRGQEMAQGLHYLYAVQSLWYYYWLWVCTIRPVRVFKVQDSLTEWVATDMSPAMYTISWAPAPSGSSPVSLWALMPTSRPSMMLLWSKSFCLWCMWLFGTRIKLDSKCSLVAVLHAGHCVDFCRLHLDVTLMYVGLGSLQSIGVFVCVWVSLLSCACFVHPSFVVGVSGQCFNACWVQVDNAVLVPRCGEDCALHALPWQ